ncbi:MAG: ABC transporter ATP-binding protein [Deltaproteobacteria bacterium]|nr:ABC transporter ATP-binding protein [Deltaproteobacteria bacterium]
MRVECCGVSKRFGRVHALRDIRLDIPSGCAVALVGPNGSGKSTLTRAIMGLIAIRGEIRFDGESRSDARSARRIANRIAYIPQIAPQVASPVGELVRAICDVREARPTDVVAVARALGFDLEAVARQGFRTLSGGMKQKTLIALALAARVDLLLMDEPTASLDARARARFFEVFAERRGDATLLLTSHRLEEIRHLVEHVVSLRDGRVAYDGGAAHYLAERELSVIEVLLQELGDAAVWLVERGFQRGAQGWWMKVVDRAEKLAILPALLARYEGTFDNLVVRDFERLDLVRAADDAAAVTPTHHGREDG